jgi:ABC-type glycerol-3-phosphate transport system substrate-binding protein
MTMKNLTLAASVTMLVAISGVASAHAAGSTTRDWAATTGQTNQQVRSAFNAFYPAMATQTVETNAHRYHGGPKSND